MQPLISILTLYKANNDLFKNLNLPTQLQDMKDAIVTEILAECGELNATYPNPDFMVNIIGTWSSLWLPSWQRTADALYKEYDIISNYTRKEKENVVHNDTENTTTKTDSISSSEDTSEIYKNAFNNDAQSKAGTNKSTATVNNDITSNTNNKKDGTRDTIRDISGLSGTTKPQELIQAEIDLANNNIAAIIIENFKDKFCVVVY